MGFLTRALAAVAALSCVGAYAEGFYYVQPAPVQYYYVQPAPQFYVVPQYQVPQQPAPRYHFNTQQTNRDLDARIERLRRLLAEMERRDLDRAPFTPSYR